MNQTPLISIISPVYKAENIVDLLVERIIEEVSKITDNFEIILVEDGSPDNSWQKIEENHFKDNRVKGIKLSRNFGQHYAVTAGIEIAKGEVCVVMDCDLQDDPVYIKLLYEKYKEGYDTVFTQRIKRKHPLFKSICTKIYRLLFNLFSDRNYNLDFGSLVLFNRKVCRELLKLKDQDREYTQILKWLGFNQSCIAIEHRERLEGKSSYTLSKLIKLGMQSWIFHSNKLLRISIYLGFILSSLSFFSILLIVFLYFYQGFQSGWASLASLSLFSTGIILVSIGITGIYIGKTFEQSKNRPLYIVDKKLL